MLSISKCFGDFYSVSLPHHWTVYYVALYQLCFNQSLYYRFYLLIFPIYQSIFAHLAQCGRLTLSSLIQKTGRSHIHVRNALVGLLKTQLILYSIDEHDRSFYEPNWDVAYYLTIRSGSFIRWVEERYDERAADVFQTILHSGVARVADLKKPHVVDATEAAKYDSPLSERSSRDGDAPVNGISDSLGYWKPGQFVDEKELYATLNLLLHHHLLEVVGEREFWPEYELQRSAESDVLESQYAGDATAVSGKRAKKVFLAQVDEVRLQWKEDAQETFYDKAFYQKGSSSRKRTREALDDEGHRALQTKRLKTNGGTPAGTTSSFSEWYQLNEEPLSVSLSCAQQCVPDRACAKRVTEG
jgi:hypothetical protein